MHTGSIQGNAMQPLQFVSLPNLTENVMSNASLTQGNWEGFGVEVTARTYEMKSRVQGFFSLNLPHVLPGCWGSHNILLHASLSLVIGRYLNNVTSLQFHRSLARTLLDSSLDFTTEIVLNLLSSNNFA